VLQFEIAKKIVLIFGLQTYQEENRDKCNWEFHLHYVGALERAVCLSLQEYQTGIRRSIADCVQALFRYRLTVTMYRTFHNVLCDYKHL
jgi:hypothetical protein